MRGQNVAVTIYPSPLPSPRPPGIRWTCSSSSTLRLSANPSLKGNLRAASCARVTDLPLELLQTNSLVTNCIVCIYEWEQQRRPTKPVTFLSVVRAS